MYYTRNGSNDIIGGYGWMDFEDEMQCRLDPIEITFIIDTTLSMTNFIQGIKKMILGIANDAIYYFLQKKTNFSDNDVRISMILYKDHDDQSEYLTKIYDFSDVKSFINNKILDEITASGGDDDAECVAGALRDVNKLSWLEKSSKFVIHVLDSPPHGKMFTSGEDNFPVNCPCDLDIDEVLSTLNSLEVNYTMIPLSENLTKTIDYFSQRVKLDVNNNLQYDKVMITPQR